MQVVILAGGVGARISEESSTRLKPMIEIGDGARINGGFFVRSKQVLERIARDITDRERKPLAGLAKENEFGAYMHSGFFQPMDTLRDWNHLEKSWSKGNAPRRVWA